MAGFFDQLDGAAAGWLKTWLTARDRRIDNDRSLTASRKDQLKKYYRSNPYLGILHRAAIENPSAFTEGGEYSEFKNFQDYDPEHNAKLRDMLVKAPDEAVDEWIYTHKPMAQRFESIMDIKHAYPNDPDAVKKIYGAYTEDTPENMDHFIKNHVLVEPQIKNRLALMKSVNDAKRYILFRKEPGKENVPLGGSEMLYTQAKDLENVLNSGNDNEIAEAISGDSLKFLGNSVKTSQNSLWREMSGILGPRSIEAKRTLVDILANEYPKQFSQDAAVTEIVRNPMYHWNALRNASSVSRTADFLSDYLEYKGRDNEKARQALRKYLYEYAVKPQIGPSERDPEPHPKKPIRTGVVEDPDWNNFVDGKIKMEAKQYNIDQGLSPLDEPTQPFASPVQQPQPQSQPQPQPSLAEKDVTQFLDAIQRSGRFDIEPNGAIYDLDSRAPVPPADVGKFLKERIQQMAEMEGVPKESMDQAKIQLFKKLSDVRMDIENNPVPLEEYFKINPGAKRRLDAFIKNETMSGKDMSGILNNLGPRYGEYIKTAISNIQQGKPSEAPPTEQAGAQPPVPPSTLGEPQIETVDKLREKGVTFENGVMKYQGQPMTPEIAHQLLGIQPETPESGFVHSLFKLQGQPETAKAFRDEFEIPSVFDPSFKSKIGPLGPAPQVPPEQMPIQPAVPPLKPVSQRPGMQEANIPTATTPPQKPVQKPEKKPPGE